jgi:hypothetical protein
MEKSLTQTGFLERVRGYGAAMASDEQTHRDLDAPAPPGSPMRQDAPDADVTPGPVPGSDPEHGEPDVQPSSDPGGPQTVPSPSTPPGEPGPDPTSDPQPETRPSGDPTPPSQADFANAQAENASSSLDEPSDNSGGE